MILDTRSRSAAMIALMAMAVLPTTLHGFVLAPPHSSSKTTIARLSSSHNAYEDEDDDMQDYENARKAFEQTVSLPSTFAASSLQSQQHDHQQQQQQYPSLLTASVERIKEMEVSMLECLQDSDAVIDPLVDLWTRERPSHAAEELISMEGYCSPGLVKEEAALRRIIDEYSNDNNDWIEPKSRLAVLLFTKGQYEEAEYWCQEVLKAKPWQFEIGQLLVVLYLRMGYYEQAILVARHYSLPPLNDRTNNKRRKAWVEAAMDAAKEELLELRTAALLAVSNNPMDECPVEVEAGGGGGMADDSQCWQ